MQRAPTVSIVTIFRNAERFIDEAIESAFAQTYRDWELLLVDDGSTDTSTSIALRYAAEHPAQVRYLEHPNHDQRGIARTRNLGMRSSFGEFVAFLDSDDIWLPDKLERQIAIMNKHPEVAMTYGPTLQWHSWSSSSDVQDHYNFTEKVNFPFDDIVLPPVLARWLFVAPAPVAWPSWSSVLFRKAALDLVNGCDDQFNQLYEDANLFIKIYLQFPAIVTSICLAKYRIHPNSVYAAAMRANEVSREKLNFLKWLKDYLRRKEFTDRSLIQFLNRDLWRVGHPKIHRLRPANLFRAMIRRVNSLWDVNTARKLK